MRKRFVSFIVAVCMLCLLAMISCSAAGTPAASGEAGSAGIAFLSTFTEIAMALYQKLNQEGSPVSTAVKINVSFNGYTYSATLADNTSAEAFAELLKSGPLTVSTHDYGSFEKVGDLETALPRNDEQITTSAGDIIPYQGKQITVYYAKNSWNFTRLGQIDNPAGLRDALGGGDVTITFSLADAAVSSANPGGFDLATKTVTLNSGYEMPINGLGTYSLHDETCVNAVKSALACGVRLIDTAHMYGNEEEIGRAIRESMKELGEFLPQVTITPALVQNEIHPYY